MIPRDHPFIWDKMCSMAFERHGATFKTAFSNFYKLIGNTNNFNPYPKVGCSKKLVNFIFKNLITFTKYYWSLFPIRILCTSSNTCRIDIPNLVGLLETMQEILSYTLGEGKEKWLLKCFQEIC